eukprot:gene14795-17930_t
MKLGACSPIPILNGKTRLTRTRPDYQSVLLIIPKAGVLRKSPNPGNENVRPKPDEELKYTATGKPPGRAQTNMLERFPGLTCDAGDAARHRCGLAPVAAVARSSRVRRRGRAASFAVSLSWCPLGVMPSGWNSVAASYR